MKEVFVRMVRGCPKKSTNQAHVNLCNGRSKYRSMATFIPVVADGVLFFNAYCADCHGIAMTKIQILSDAYAARCSFSTKSTSFKDDATQSEWVPFRQDIICPRTIVNPNKKFTMIWERAADFCDCNTIRHKDDCPSTIYSNECLAYRAISENNSIAKNDACSACFHERNMRQPAVIKYPHCVTNSGSNSGGNSGRFVEEYTSMTQIFKFSPSLKSRKCPVLYDTGRPGNLCLVKTCQPGYRLYSGKCMSPVETMACFHPHEDYLSPHYHIADLYRPVFLIFMKHQEWKRYELGEFEQSLYKLLSGSKPCTLLKQKIYRDLIFDKLPLHTQCRLLPLAALSFTNVVQQVESGIYNGGQFGSASGFKFAVINHDPVAGLNCSGNIGYEVITHRINTSFWTLEFRTRNINKIIASNSDPMIISKRGGKPGLQKWVLFCQPNDNRDSCHWRNNEISGSFETCPKYELTSLPKFMKGNQTTVTHQQSSHKQSIFLCSDAYDEQYADTPSHIMVIVVMACYIVSLLCLLTTFCIHVRYRSLRTLPGLMLMNLIVALFIAQLIYIMNSFKPFQKHPNLCQTMAAVQHYFWLASFVWMACMSLDIFSCLSASCTTVKTYSAAKYCKYVLIGWMAPLPVPIMTITLTNMDLGQYGYDLTLCWLSGGNAVLLVFALPALAIVCFNLVLFVGSVCRLSLLMKNAAYVGRKEDNKRRLIQCAKLSSWMGISWLFGIVPNFLDIEALWYVFGVANAFQGVHIFAAFGFSGKARELMKRGREEKTSFRDSNSTALRSLPSISQDVQ